MSNTNEHQHQFWKDRNPDTCFTCGKTEKELYVTLTIEEYNKLTNKQYEHKFPNSNLRRDSCLSTNQDLSYPPPPCTF